MSRCESILGFYHQSFMRSIEDSLKKIANTWSNFLESSSSIRNDFFPPSQKIKKRGRRHYLCFCKSIIYDLFVVFIILSF